MLSARLWLGQYNGITTLPYLMQWPVAVIGLVPGTAQTPADSIIQASAASGHE